MYIQDIQRKTGFSGSLETRMGSLTPLSRSRSRLLIQLRKAGVENYRHFTKTLSKIIYIKHMKLVAWELEIGVGGGDKGNGWINSCRMVGFYLKVPGPHAWCHFLCPWDVQEGKKPQPCILWVWRWACLLVWMGFTTRLELPAQTGSRKGCEKEYLG